MTTVPPQEFAAINVSERGDLQRLLRDNPDGLEHALGEKLFILSEEYSNWKDSDRRVDLLALDKGERVEDSSVLTAHLVVIELKVAEGGGHMELQAVRYAAMLSNMNFSMLVETYERFSKKTNAEAQSEILKFLENPDSGEIPESEHVLISKSPRIILISPNFSIEITTTVLWLNEQGLDIQCVEATPYRIGADIFLDLEQVIPLPEAKEFMVQRREKAQKEASASLQRRPTNKPTKITWADDVNNPTTVNTWRGVLECVVQRAFLEGLPPDDLPMNTDTKPDDLLAPSYFPARNIYVSLHGSADAIQGWATDILVKLNARGKKLGLQVDRTTGAPLLLSGTSDQTV